jgi:hypothetical protein
VSQPAVAQCERAPLRVSAKAAPSLPRITNAINDALKGFGAVLLVSPVLTKSWPRYERQAQILARDETFRTGRPLPTFPRRPGMGFQFIQKATGSLSERKVDRLALFEQPPSVV